MPNMELAGLAVTVIGLLWRLALHRQGTRRGSTRCERRGDAASRFVQPTVPRRRALVRHARVRHSASRVWLTHRNHGRQLPLRGPRPRNRHALTA
ncbi:hypothetical protein F4553_000814 [Allocatelliglobosispora scoriae]|uniref:Uncharacterized protein n=1 Tax=Allocatelliglobosispora scoriae TaxID=643052 RepID=A0A841BIK4_9ACTN|nr:hypothetical protein [Allocatelliglobosispora scoriae]